MGDNSFVRSFIARLEEKTELPHPRLSYSVIYVLIEGLRGKRLDPLRALYATECVFKRGGGRVRCRGGKDGCDSTMVSTVPIIALLYESRGSLKRQWSMAVNVSPLTSCLII